MAVVEYAHLAVKLDLRDAMAEVKEACENIQRTANHCRQHAEGMDIHELCFVRMIYVLSLIHI